MGQRPEEQVLVHLHTEDRQQGGAGVLGSDASPPGLCLPEGHDCGWRPQASGTAGMGEAEGGARGPACLRASGRLSATPWTIRPGRADMRTCHPPRPGSATDTRWDVCAFLPAPSGPVSLPVPWGRGTNKLPKSSVQQVGRPCANPNQLEPTRPPCLYSPHLRCGNRSPGRWAGQLSSTGAVGTPRQLQPTASSSHGSAARSGPGSFQKFAFCPPTPRVASGPPFLAASPPARAGPGCPAPSSGWRGQRGLPAPRGAVPPTPPQGPHWRPPRAEAAAPRSDWLGRPSVPRSPW